MVFVAPADMRTRSKGRRSERANRARQMTLPKKPYRGAEANQQPSTKSASHCGFQGQKQFPCTRLFQVKMKLNIMVNFSQVALEFLEK